MMPFKVMRRGVAAPPDVVVTLAPASQIAGPAPDVGWIFPPVLANVSGGTPTSYVWSIVNPVVGVWEIYSGQGTNTGRVRVMSMPEGETAECLFKCTVTVAGFTFSDEAYTAYTRHTEGPPD
jgi:hypothetical protein